ncbi:MAG: RnfABCDGE type electron transport complex subunit D, partial [Terriglobia bacterium]
MILQDARLWQAIVLGSVLLFGIRSLDFPLDATTTVCTLATGVLSEYGFAAVARTSHTPRPLSALISALSVLLLFRSTTLWTYLIVIVLAVASKYLIRFRGQHWLNPTNFAVLTGTLLLPGWVSSGQWGHLSTVPLALGGLGILVVLRAGRLDSALAFLGSSAFLELSRLSYYGYPHLFDLFTHRFSNGALWLFTFYMITDPKTTPQQRWGRIMHAAVVAFVSLLLSEWYWKDTFLWALLFTAPLVPLFDW